MIDMCQQMNSFLSGNCRSKLLINGLVFAIGALFGRMTNWSSGMADPKPSPVSSTEFHHYQFDEMHKHLYQIANKPVLTSRKPYNLGAVERSTTGGLMDSDRELLAGLYYNATSVFEFGLGESTHIAGYVGVPRFAGVDSDAVWVGKARDGAKRDHFSFSFADIGKTLKWGFPANKTLQKIPFTYQSGPLNNEMEAFDFYLVDGRYRVACACASFLHAISRGGDMSRIMVAVHDWDRDWGYWELKDISDVIMSSQKLGVLKLKSNTSEHDILNMWKSHMWDKR